MTSTVNSDNGAVSGVPGVKKDGDSSGVLALQTNGSSAITVSTSQNATLNSTGAVTLPIGTTAQRPAPPADGMTRINTTTNTLEVYSTVNSSWNALSIFTNAPPSIEYLVVAGGGGACAGGSGAGGYRTASGFSISAGTPYNVTVGAGGAGTALYTTPAVGSNSIFSTITSTGGGYGGVTDATDYNGGAGGSGGGGAGDGRGSTGGAGTAGQGSNGGNGGSGSPYPGGGGGGASAVGSAGASSTGGAGGAGSASSISGSSVTYAGGGGGGVLYSGGTSGGAGGAGGGGAGNTAGAGTSGTANTGGGGGGFGNYVGGPLGGSGGSGIVIIRYADTYGAATSTTGSPTITVAGGYRVYTWTSSGTITF
jgi:hypothetical protein